MVENQHAAEYSRIDAAPVPLRGDRKHEGKGLYRAMRALNVLVTTSYYWPEVAGSGPLLTNVAEYLSEAGHDVMVVTGFAHYPEWRSSTGRRLFATEERAGVTVRRRWHYVPRLQSAGHRAFYELSLFAFGLTAFPRRWRPDVVLGTCPSLAGGAHAAAASRVYGIPYGLVFQDLMGLAAQQSGVAGGKRVAGVVRKVELALARRAGRVGIIAEGFRRYLEAGGVPADKIERLRNCARRVEPAETVAETRGRLGWTPNEFVALHGGNMGHKQGLDNLLNTAALLRGAGVRIVLAGDGNDRDRLERRARELALTHLDFIELQPPGRWEAVMEAADILLVNQRASVTDMSLPSKLTSYFGAGRAVVAAASADSETADEIGAAEAGIVVPPDDPRAFRDAILSLRNDVGLAEKLGRHGRIYAESVLSPASVLAEYESFVEDLASRNGQPGRLGHIAA
jgi:colanic acid biosynthesis glycosyl transferase WcaI